MLNYVINRLFLLSDLFLFYIWDLSLFSSKRVDSSKPESKEWLKNLFLNVKFDFPLNGKCQPAAFLLAHF